ncbi:MAG: IS21 family transposase [Gemmatimonadales bacterium]|nr:IS21 family transposase [Gemmatimonadales bacterium]
MIDIDPESLMTLPTSPPDEAQPPPRKRGRKRIQIPDEIRQEILRLQPFYSARQISPRVGLSRKMVGRVLHEHGLSSGPQPGLEPEQPDGDTSKLDSFQLLVAEKMAQGLKVTRILREIRKLGYQGGRTILGDYVRQLRAQTGALPTASVKRRFETGVAEEMQIDWSPYEVPIGGHLVRVHVLGCLLAWSRKLYAYAFRDERQPTLLEGLACAFVYFDGVAARIVLDNMSTAVLGRVGSDGKVLWHSRFLDFTRHYGTVPFACRVRDPDRKGKKEKSFRLLEDDFIRGSSFDSLDHLNEQLRIWLDGTAQCGNLRVHGTTRRVPNEAFEHERPLLVRLPNHPFTVCEQSVRVVDRDSTLSIRGTPYSVPATLANRSVAVHLFAEHFEVLDQHGRVAFSRRYVSERDKGRLVIDKTHYANLPRRPRTGSAGDERIDQAFVRRFAELQPLVDGLKRRMKSLAPIHIRTLLRLCDRFGEEAFLVAARRAQDFRRFDALAVGRILESDYPAAAAQADAACPVTPLSGHGPAALGEVDSGSLDSFSRLDSTTALNEDAHGSQQ